MFTDRRVIFGFGILLLSPMLGMPLPEGGGEEGSSEAQRQMVVSKLSSLPLSFSQNKGQWGERTKFRCDAPGATFYFAQGEVAYLLIRETDELTEHQDVMDKPMRPRYKREGLLVRTRFIGANPRAEVIGEDVLPHRCNYFYGNDPTKWCTDVPNYPSVRYRNIYPGIDLRYYGDGHSLKYEFIIESGGNPSLITIEYEGVDSLWVNDRGELVLSTSFGEIRERVPYSYQKIGDKMEVPCYYTILDRKRFGFVLDGAYDRKRPLYIDPELVYSTYLGGLSDDRGYSIALDGSGNAYLTGRTYSRHFPTVNPYDGTHNGGGDVFITKLSQSGNSLIYSTYLGGSDYDCGLGIALDSSGNAYVTGETESSNFPTVNPYDGTHNSSRDVFITKLSANALSCEIADCMSKVFALSQTFPNPFIDRTSIRYQLLQNGKVQITIYNLLGQEVKTLLDDQQNAGPHTVIWDATDNSGRKVSSGPYFLRLEAGEHTATRKLSVMR